MNLPPGKHTFRLILNAGKLNSPGNDEFRLLSNPVEIEISKDGQTSSGQGEAAPSFCSAILKFQSPIKWESRR